MLQQLSAILILDKVTDAKSYAVFIISNYFTPKPQTVIRQSVFFASKSKRVTKYQLNHTERPLPLIVQNH